MKFRYLDHTADACFEAFGKDLNEAFSNAVPAMFGLMYDTSKIKEDESRWIQVKGIDEKALLSHFLDQLLFLFDTEFFWPARVKSLAIKKLKPGCGLTAEILGDVNIGQYESSGGIKAVTYNRMEIKKGKPCSVTVVVDL